MSFTPERRPNGPSPRQRTSSGSVKVTYLDPQAIRDELGSAVRELASRHPEIERALLFGSLATGGAVPGSDADLLIILKSSDRPFLDRIPVYTPEGCRIGIDVFPYTGAEVQRMLAAGNWFLKRALAEGIELPLATHSAQ